MSTPGELERVLRADDWLRRIARRLAGDPHVAEDLAQDAWVAALAAGRSDRPWLFGVLRNLRRTTQRHATREASLAGSAAREAEAPPTDEVVDDLLLRKRVTDGLLELEEPYRTALYLRFVQDLGLAAIARRTGVAVSTVHQRIAHGLELLRRHMDARYDGRRRAWALGLLSLAKPQGLALSLGGLVMGTSAKVAGVVLLLSGAVFWLWPSGEPARALAGTPSEPLESEAALARTELATPDRVVERASAPAAPSAPVPAASTPFAAPILGRVVDLGGQPVAAVRVGFEGEAGAAAGSVALTDGQGRFELPPREEQATERPLTCLEPELVTLVHGLPQDELRLVVVGRAADFAGVVTGPTGQPIAGAEVRFDLRQSLFRERGVVRPWIQPEHERRMRTGTDGRFAFATLCGGEHVGLWVEADGYQGRSVDLPAFGDPALHVVLEPSTGRRVLAGLVLDEHGAPVAGASVSAGTEIVRSDADGAFRLSWQREGAENHVQGEDGGWMPERDSSVLRAVLAGTLPVEVVIDELVPGETIVLRLGGAPPSIRGRLVDERGAPRSGVIVWAGPLTPFGTEEQTSGGAKAVWELHLEEVCGGRAARGQVTGADGRFELAGLLPKTYDVHAHDPATAGQGGPWRLQAGAEEIELVLAAEPDATRVAGRVVTAGGRALADVWIVPRRSRTFNDDSQPPHLEGVALGTRSDDEGRFEFAALATAGTVLELQHESFFIRHVALAGRDDLAHLELVQPVLCELQVELQDRAFADSLVVLDADERELEVLEAWGAFLSSGTHASFAEGKTSVLRVVETARTLVLRKDEREVLRRPLHLDPSQRAELRL